MGMLHLFEEVTPRVTALRRCLRPGGELFLSSLVENGRRGDAYLRLLHRAGEVAAPRTARELEEALRGALGREAAYCVRGNMAYASVQAP
jgi:hypothetical protein